MNCSDGFVRTEDHSGSNITDVFVRRHEQTYLLDLALAQLAQEPLRQGRKGCDPSEGLGRRREIKSRRTYSCPIIHQHTDCLGDFLRPYARKVPMHSTSHRTSARTTNATRNLCWRAAFESVRLQNQERERRRLLARGPMLADVLSNCDDTSFTGAAPSGGVTTTGGPSARPTYSDAASATVCENSRRVRRF